MDEKEIRVHTDKNGKDHIDIYSNDPKGDHTSIHINVDTTNGEKETTDTQCYLTTACMRQKMENFDDNCEELTVLRWFRDKFVSKEDKEHYYKIAPIIVEAINENENNNKIYDYIYNNIIIACVSAIKDGNYEFAYNKYKDSVLVLEEQFARPKLERKLANVLRLKY